MDYPPLPANPAREPFDGGNNGWTIAQGVAILNYAEQCVRAWPFHPRPHIDDVGDFHARFGVPEAPMAALLDAHTQRFRRKFMQEELDEFRDACADGDLAKAFDALLDLEYVLLGTARMMGLATVWQAGWDEVQRANMTKQRAARDGSDSKRGSGLDVVKPAGWTPPDLAPLVGGAPWPTADLSGLPPDPWPRDAIQAFHAELDALKSLSEQLRRIELTPVVDDDYPAVRRAYEHALAVFLRAARDAGRSA
jgi:predicted HAD superfamily Cof-like phosphohydrolase